MNPTAPAFGGIQQPALAIARLSLSNFRSYVAAQLATSGRPVVLTGSNGGGKTNILDAISMLAPGRGLRSSDLADHVRKGPTLSSSLWAVAATISRGAETYEVGTGLAASASGVKTRQVRLNGSPAQTSAELGEIIEMTWLTPAMDRLFIEGASGRRRLIDRLTLGFSPTHARSALGYEQAMRERARLLKYGPRDAAWLGALEDQMASHGLALACARSATVGKLNDALREREQSGTFPSATLRMDGGVDELLGAESEKASTVFRERLEHSRVRDSESGRTCWGPHLSDLIVRHSGKCMDARDCSTGEQKSLLISILLAHARQLSHIKDGIAPVLLLDEIVAHLDDFRRVALFQEILAVGAQAWMTGTDSSMFAQLRGYADFFEVADSRITLISE